MPDVFDRYHECNELVESMEHGEDREHAKTMLTQLLHLEQARKVAISAYNKYCREMNDWENNIVKSIMRIVKGE